MTRKWKLCLLLALLLAVVCGGALAQEARDVTSECALKAKNGKRLNATYDQDYSTCWNSGGGKNAWVEVTAPEGETLGGVWVQWYQHALKWRLQVLDGGEWTDVAQSDTGYLSDYLSLPEGTTSFRLATAKGVPSRMSIAEMHIYTTGDLPEGVQRWQPQAEKADLLVVVAHPDDEILFMGGSIPYYAGEVGKTVQVAYLTASMPYRRLELLDGLWLCGVRNYPDLGGFADAYAGTLKDMYKRWSKETVYTRLTRLFRRYRPDVVVTHDINGEYGHGAHRACADAAMHALSWAANPARDAKSRKQYGTWDVPKLYIHLYPENVVDMDWRKPLTAFDGKTAFDMAEAAFRCHISQQKTRYVVEDFGPYDNSLFGLYRSLVGPDVEKDDFFENIPQTTAGI